MKPPAYPTKTNRRGPKLKLSAFLATTAMAANSRRDPKLKLSAPPATAADLKLFLQLTPQQLLTVPKW